MTKDAGPILFREDSALPHSLLRAPQDDWGIIACDLVTPPRRFWSDTSQPPSAVELAVDLRRLSRGATPAEILRDQAGDESWSSQTRRSLSRLRSYFLVCEDPQRRLDARAVNTLAHQVSLARHVLDNTHLRRALIADEVGLGKTIETGLIIAELLELNPGLRVLYLAPARLVRNVRQEFDRLKLGFRQWTAFDRDAVLQDNRIIASIHKAVHGGNFEAVVESGPWDVLVVDECHHLSDWAIGGGDPKENYRLVKQLIERLPEDGRVLFLSGTPHQGHLARFENLLRLLRTPSEDENALAGRVIYRIKDDVRDWEGNPLFPSRQVNEPIIFAPRARYRAWIQRIYDFYHPGTVLSGEESRQRAAGWRCAQALQWAASSPQAGLGYLVRQALRAGWTLKTANLSAAIAALRPYRGGAGDEPIESLYKRLLYEIDFQASSDELEDTEEIEGRERQLDPSAVAELASLLEDGLAVLAQEADSKWLLLKENVLDPAGSEKVVLFAQPIETVTALAGFLERTYGNKPAIIIGGQSDEARQNEIDRFRDTSGPQFLVSSRAGGEGINLQIARRLVHVDVPWNPMELEQRVGRVHRFGSSRKIIVDTLIAQGSREEEAYRIARQKLALVVGTLVERERFESVFSRVMALVGQEELQGVMLGGAGAPMTNTDQERLGALVRQGFGLWKAFHDKYSDEQKRIRELDPGLAAWEDVDAFLRDEAGAQDVPGFCAQRFAARNGEVESVLETARVLTFDGDSFFACGDYSGAPVFGPQGQVAAAIGLNSSPVATALRRLAFAAAPVGAAHVRWPGDRNVPCELKYPFGVLVLLRQTLRSEQATWTEISATLHTHVISADGQELVIDGPDRATLLRGLFKGTVRVKPEDDSALVSRLVSCEADLIANLRRITPMDGEKRVRHSVTPLFAGIIGSPA